MEKEQVREFAKFEVFEIVNNNYHCICICDNMDIACNIAKMFAMNDPKGDSYHVTSIDEPGTFTWGGGWRYDYYRDKDGKLRESALM